jgi:catechol 2,3-dioxygenase-like lactoylglutathione lyase family enzyme
VKPSISLITLGVRDLERAVAFYQDGLGWPLSRTSVEGEVAFFRTGGTVLALWSREALAEDASVDAEGSGFSGFALAHNVAHKEEVDAVLEEAVSAGATVLKEAQDVFFGRNGYFADPEGYLWEVAWNPTFPMAEDGTIRLPD